MLLGPLLFLLSLRADAFVLAAGDGLAQPVRLSAQVEYLFDASNALTIEKILAAPAEAGFKAGDVESFTGYTHAAIWVRFSLQRARGGPDDWVVKVSPNWLDDVKVYSGDSGRGRLLAEVGDLHPFSARAVKISQLAFPVTLGDAPQTYYLRIKTHGPVPLLLNAWQKPGLEKNEAERTIFYLVFSGGVGVMVLMALVFWAWIRGVIYFLYAVFLLGISSALFAFQGYGSSLFFPDSAVWADRFTDIAACVFMSTAALFVSRLFEYETYSPAVARLLDVSAVVFAAPIPLIMMGEIGQAIWWVETLGVLLTIFNNFFIAWIIFRCRAYQHAFSATAFFLVNTSWIFYGGVNLGFIHLQHWTSEGALVQFFQIINLVLLSIAVAARAIQIELQLKHEQQNALSALKIAEKALEERTRQQEFVAVISHEFRTPLAVIGAVSHALAVSPSGQDERVKTSMGKVGKAVHRLSALIENILLDDALEMNATQAGKDFFDLKELIEGVGSLGSPDEDSRLLVNVPDAPLFFAGNRARIEMALRNIVQNAVKYSDRNRVVEVRCHLLDGRLAVDVMNAGRPIPRSEQGSLFERYFRGVQSSRISGSGLGLHISRTIARQHGGDVVLLSSDARGTVFRLSLPLGAPNSGVAPTRPAGAAITP